MLLHEQVGLPALLKLLCTQAATHEASEVDHGRLCSKALLALSHVAESFIIGSSAPQKLHQRKESVVRRGHAGRNDSLEEISSYMVFAIVAATFEDVCQNDVIWSAAQRDHVVYNVQRALQVMGLHASLDEHGAGHNIRPRLFTLLHKLVEFRSLIKFTHTNENLHHICAYERILWSTSDPRQTNELLGNGRVVAYEAGIQKRAQSDIIRLKAVLCEHLHSIATLIQHTSLSVPFDESVVGDNVHHGLFLADVELVRLVQAVHSAVKLLLIDASQ
mmetsp:Transcript_57236/g.100218  ORF Transcript_57236/g.100218 Transcript_57236/m.100218 type:complete len:275 (-) Transcript_57236:1057-1881(-)